MSDYFEIFGLKKSYEIDLETLEKNYFKLQAAFHPDKFANASSAARQAAILRSMEINNIYEILSDDFRRAQYLLELEGIIVGTDADTVKPSQELLIKNMSQREALAEGKNLQELFEKSQFERKNLVAALTKNFAASQFEEAANNALELLYLNKFLAEARGKL